MTDTKPAPLPRLIRASLALAALALLLVTTAASATDQWVHVKVESADADQDQVTINLPLSLISAAAAMIPAEVYDEAEIALDDLEMDWRDLVNLWQEIKTSPDATYVTVQTRDETVKVWKQGAYLLVNTTEKRNRRGTDVDVKFPLAVIDALLSGPDGRLDFGAALHALAAHGPGNLVSVRDGDQTVRVWIDNKNEAD